MSIASQGQSLPLRHFLLGRGSCQAFHQTSWHDGLWQQAHRRRTISQVLPHGNSRIFQISCIDLTG